MSEYLKINVNDHTEKKGNLTYLSWCWAWAEVLKSDPAATWEAIEFNGLPCVFLPDESALVKTVVTIKGQSKSCWLPVMDHKNKAIKNPDAFAVNTAIVRCMTKAIAMHGLGLYIYAGEDLPERDVNDYIAAIKGSETQIVLKNHFAAAWKMSGIKDHPALKEAYDKRIAEITEISDSLKKEATTL